MADPLPIVTTGRYAYSRDGIEAPVAEPFTISPRDGAVLVTSERIAPGTRLNVDVAFAADHSSESLLTWASDLDGLPQLASMRYLRAANGVITADGTVEETRHEHVLDVDNATSFFPLMRVFSGRTLLRLIAAGEGGVDVITPDIRDPKQHDVFLQPLVDHRSVGTVDDTTLDVDGVTHPCVKVEYLGGSYDQPATVWVDASGLLLRYTWDQPGVGDWDVRVCDIEGPWPAPKEW